MVISVIPHLHALKTKQNMIPSWSNIYRPALAGISLRAGGIEVVGKKIEV